MKKLFSAGLVIGFIIPAMLLSGCGNGPITPRYDQCVMERAFNNCMAAIPKAPERAITSDWDEVIDSCRISAVILSRRMDVKLIPPGCLGD